MKTSVRAAGIKSINNNRGGLGASELHGKRLDTTSQKRIIAPPKSINWSKAGENNGLDLVDAFKAHKKEMGAVERGNTEIGTHLLVVVPPEWIREGGDIYDPNNPNTLKAIQAAKEWAESWQGEGAVFAYRFDLDEKGSGVIDLFSAPVFEQGRRNGKTVKTLSPSMAKRELVKKTGEKTSGAAFQTSWAEWAETHLDARMERGNRKKETGREHVHAEVYAKVAEETKLEVKKEFEAKVIEENDKNERIRAARQAELEAIYEARQRQLFENFEDRKKQLEDDYDDKEWELEKTYLEKMTDYKSLEEIRKNIADLQPKLAKREADLEKREASVEANEAKKLKLFNKSQVIQDKLGELETAKAEIEAGYQAKEKKLEADYQNKFRNLDNDFKLKHSSLDKEIVEARDFVKQGLDIKTALRENEKLKAQLKSMEVKHFNALSGVNAELQVINFDLAKKTKTIETQEKEIGELTLSKNLLDFIADFLNDHFSSVFQKVVEAWGKSPENPNNKNRDDDYDYSGPSM